MNKSTNDFIISNIESSLTAVDNLQTSILETDTNENSLNNTIQNLNNNVYSKFVNNILNKEETFNRKISYIFVKLCIKCLIKNINCSLQNKNVDKDILMTQKHINNLMLQFSDDFFRYIEVKNNSSQYYININNLFNKFNDNITNLNKNQKISGKFKPYSWFIIHFEKYFPLYIYDCTKFAYDYGIINDFEKFDEKSLNLLNKIINVDQKLLFKKNFINSKVLFWNTDIDFRKQLSSYQRINDILVYHILITQFMHLLSSSIVFTKNFGDGDEDSIISMFKTLNSDNKDLLFLTLLFKFNINYFSINKQELISVTNIKKHWNYICYIDNNKNELKPILNFLWILLIQFCQCNYKKNIQMTTLSFFCNTLECNKLFIKYHNSRLNLIQILPKVINYYENELYQYYGFYSNIIEFINTKIFSRFNFFANLINFATIMTKVNSKNLVECDVKKHCLYNNFVKNFINIAKLIQNKSLNNLWLNVWIKRERKIWLLISYSELLSTNLIFNLYNYSDNLQEDNINWIVSNSLLVHVKKLFDINFYSNTHKKNIMLNDILDNLIYDNFKDNNKKLFELYNNLLSEEQNFVLHDKLYYYIKKQLNNSIFINYNDQLGFFPLFFYQFFFSSFINLIVKKSAKKEFDIASYIKNNNNRKLIKKVIIESLQKDLIYQYTYCCNNRVIIPEKFDIIKYYKNIENFCDKIDIVSKLFNTDLNNIITSSYDYIIRFSYTFKIPKNLKNITPIFNINNIHIIRDNVAHKNTLVWLQPNWITLPKLSNDNSYLTKDSNSVTYLKNKNNYLNIKRNFNKKNNELFYRARELNFKKPNNKFLYELHKTLVKLYYTLNKKSFHINIDYINEIYYYSRINNINKDDINKIVSVTKTFLKNYMKIGEVYRRSVSNKNVNFRNPIDVISNPVDYQISNLYKNIIFCDVFKDSIYTVPSFLCSRTRLYESGFTSQTSFTYTRLLHISAYNNKINKDNKNIFELINNSDYNLDNILNTNNEFYNTKPFGLLYTKYIKNKKNPFNINNIPYSWDMPASNLLIFSSITRNTKKVLDKKKDDILL